MGVLPMGFTGCGYVIASKAMEAAQSVGCVLGHLHIVDDRGFTPDMYRDVAWMIAMDPINKIALVVGIVIGVNYMNLVNTYQRKKRKKK